ncbi:MAG: hypothetical protein IKA33_02390 [Candidatus Methanomethylophilaceae archaeon]|nr:hypothetical protein [Candidatus Methanomethylophilaceae archaeon]
MYLDKLKTDRKGSVEGIPLQFMIMMIVAVAAVGILGGWMANISTPQSISDVEVASGVASCESDGSLSDIVILVRDQDGNPLEGGTVILEGLGIQMFVDADENGTIDEGETEKTKAVLQTGEDGKAEFTGLSITPPKGGFGSITVNVMKSGYGEFNSTEIVVVTE